MDLFEENHNVIVFKCNINNITLEDFLYGNNISGRLFRKTYKSKHVYLNGKFVNKSTLLIKDDIVTIYMDDEENSIAPLKMDLDIIYEDHDLLIINKQANIVVHPTRFYMENTLSNGVAYHFTEHNIRKKIRFVNRLDMDTTGIIIVAKNPFAHQQVAIQFEENTVLKKYYAIVKGVLEKDEGIIDLPIGQEGGSIRKLVTMDGQDALTAYKVIERFNNTTLLDVQIFTGKSHQIRVHMNHIGHPIIGDALYYEKSPYINRQALHSYYLKIMLPRSNNEVEFTTPLPDDIKNAIHLMKY